MAFWFCIKHHTVEGDEGCRAKDRLGPYDTEAEASRALETAAERTEEWDNDPQWNDDVEARDGADGRD
ncbi:hypothetical protein [Nocardioides sambongensis]|uniref:hypothetical protein n=1 Tax=Nocardioides sambongensis TaxID=2589074 RepID=UPI0011273797|nr:hypothetical protein [Nocardioides sambongensis]